MNTENKPTVQLTGQDANAYAIIGACRRAAKKAGWSREKIQKVTDEMTSGDYDNLLVVAIKYFNVE